jgi:hypothetical protein
VEKVKYFARVLKYLMLGCGLALSKFYAEMQTYGLKRRRYKFEEKAQAERG